MTSSIRNRALQGGDRARIPQVALALSAVGILPADIEHRRGFGDLRVAALVAVPALFGEHVDIDPGNARGGAGEVGVDHLRREPDGFEDLRALVALQGADTHLAHHLEQALVDRLDVLGLGDFRIFQARKSALANHLADGFECQVGVESRPRRNRAAAQSGAPRARRPPSTMMPIFMRVPLRMRW